MFWCLGLTLPNAANHFFSIAKVQYISDYFSKFLGEKNILVRIQTIQFLFGNFLTYPGNKYIITVFSIWTIKYYTRSSIRPCNVGRCLHPRAILSCADQKTNYYCIGRVHQNHTFSVHCQFNIRVKRYRLVWTKLKELNPFGLFTRDLFHSPLVAPIF